MNPPFHSRSDDSHEKTQALWHKFVFKAIDLLKDDGYLLDIHPSGWRNVAGSFKKTQLLLRSKSMKYLKMHSFKDSKDLFNVAIGIDSYVLQNNNKHGLTNIVFKNGKEEAIDISELEFIPSENFDEIMSLVAKEGEEKVEMINNSAYHHVHSHMKREANEAHIYPCVYTVKGPSQNNTPTFWYSTFNTKGHFGVPKVIFACGSSGVMVDKKGEYGMTEFGSGIVDKPENLESIQKALVSEKFVRCIMGFEQGSPGDKYNRRVIATFRKDFWKKFI
jgi:hypothetical protein